MLRPQRAVTKAIAGLAGWILMLVTATSVARADPVHLLDEALFILKNGQEFEGHVLDSTRVSVSIHRTIGGLQLVRLANIDEVRLRTARGEPLIGRLLGWSDGVYVVETEGSKVRVQNGQVLNAETVQTEPVESEPAAIAAPRSTHSEHDHAAETGVEAEAHTAALPEGLLTIDITAKAATESESALAFEIKTSEPVDGPLALVFSTLDGSAIGGDDYEAYQGVITLQPGDSLTELRVILINDDVTEADEQFELFVSVDPSVARLSTTYIVATIRDDD